MDIKKIAKERMRILIGLSSEKYVRLAERIGKRTRTHMPKELKMKYCKKCKTPFTTKTLKVRIKDKTVIYECLKCGFLKRYPFKKKK